VDKAMLLRKVLRWTLFALVTWFVFSLLLGVGYGLYWGLSDNGVVVAALGGMLVPFLAFFRFIYVIAPAFLVACACWSMIANRAPRVEASSTLMNIWLGAYSALFGIGVWLSLSLDRRLVAPVAVLSILALCAPRLMVADLRAGAFAG
jgi:hypothetical protein